MDFSVNNIGRRLPILFSALVLSCNGVAPSQLRVHLAATPDALVFAWTSKLATGEYASIKWGEYASIKWGPAGLSGTKLAISTLFDNVYCASNSTRISSYAEIPVPAGGSVSFSVTTDGSTWSEPRIARNPQRGYPSRIALWGDLGVECGGVLPPSPGFAGGRCSAGDALASDVSAGRHEWALHFGDTSYDMSDECGDKGDRFLDAASAWSVERPIIYTNGNHESSGPLKPYTEFTKRLAWGQTPLADASGSTNVRWMSWRAGPATFFSLDPDGWIYPLVYDIMPSQFAWLESAISRVNRTETPWLVFAVHRAMYCTKSTDGECNSEAEALRNGQLGLLYALEPLLAKYGVDFYFSGHTHHVEWTWPTVRGAAVATHYDSPQATIHVQSGIAGTGPGDEFSVPQQPWEAFRDEEYWPTYGRLTFHNDSAATYEQLFNDNGTVFKSFDVTNAMHGGGW